MEEKRRREKKSREMESKSAKKQQFPSISAMRMLSYSTPFGADLAAPIDGL